MKSKLIKKVSTSVVGFATVVSLSGMGALAPMTVHGQALTEAQISALLSLLQSFGADAATVANVNSALRGEAPTTPAPAPATACNFTRDLTLGSTGADAQCLQQYLNSAGHQVAASGAGSPGNETQTFGSLTRAALAAWQAANGVSPAVGYFGPLSRAKYAELTAGAPTTPPTTTPPPAGTGLTVRLAPDSPDGTALVQGQALGELIKLTLGNPTASEMRVTNMSFSRIGVSEDATLTNVYLYRGGERLTDAAGVSLSKFSFNNPAGLFTVPALSTATISVRSDIAASTNGQQVGARLDSMTASGVLDPSNQLPLSGGLQLISSATLATASWGAVTPSGGTENPANEVRVYESTLTVNTRAANLNSITFENRGTSNDGDLRNLKLYIDGTQVGNTIAQFNNKRATFDLSSSPLRLETGNRLVRLTADIVSGSTRTYQVTVRRDADMLLVDAQLGQPMAVTAPTAGSAVTIAGGALSVTRASDSPTDNVALGSTNVRWAKYEFRASGEDVRIETMTVNPSTGSQAGGLRNGRVVVNGTQVGSTRDIAEAGTDFTFGSSFVARAGMTEMVEIWADAKTTTGTDLASGAAVSMTVAIAAADTQGLSSGDPLSSAISAVSSNTRSIASTSLTLTKASGYGDQTMIAGTNNAKLGSFVLSAPSTEGVNVNTITINLSSDEAATVTNLRLIDASNGTQQGTTRTTPSTSNAYSVSINLPASGTRTLDLVGDLKSGSNDGTWQATAEATGSGATTGQSVNAGSATALQTITLGSGTLTDSVAAANPDSAITLMGAANALVGAFEFSSANTSWTVQELKVKIPADAATSVAAVKVRYTNSAGQTVTTSQALTLPSGSQTHATATFTGLDFYVPTNDTRNLQVLVDVAPHSSAKSGASISALIDANEGYKALDSAGTSTTTLAAGDLNSAATTGKGTMVVRRSKPTLSSTPASGTLTAGSNQTIGRVTVTADAANAIEWKKMVFNVNKTAAITLGATSTMKLYRGTTEVAGTFATTTGSHADVDALQGLTSGNIVFTATTAEQVAAGTSETYELRVTVGAIASGNNTVDVRLADTSTSATTGTASAVVETAGDGTNNSFVWSDRSATPHSETTADWTNDFLVKTLPLTVGNRSVSF